METLCLEEIAQAISGEIIGDKGIKIDNISIDSRQIEQGDLFIAIRGENFDGHNFMMDAFTRGASVAIVSKEIDLDIDKTIIKVEDTTKALQDLAHYYRNKFDITVVAVTGSTGKTTTKDMIAAVLGMEYKTLKTAGNFNNEIGLPLTLFRLDSSYEAVVVEMGMRALGEIDLLAKIAEPDIGVITNVGVAHIEILKSVDNIAKAKSELIVALKADGVAILNGDDDKVKKMDRLTTAEVINYGLKEYNKVRATEIKSLDDGAISFNLLISNNCYQKPLTLPVPGRYNVYNALAAVAVGLVLDISLKEIVEGLSNFQLTKMRNQILTTEDGVKIIDDTYNANPASMRGAIDTLFDIGEGRRIAVLGDMLELGDIAIKEHQAIGSILAEKGIDYLFTYGELGNYIGEGAKDSGMDNSSIFSYQDKAKLIEDLLDIITVNDTILVKASRGMKLEEVSQALLED